MGRERRELKKIERVTARRVTFAKRRKGLLKKAKELSILCEADVGLVIFSATGKLFEYSNTSMKMILKKYFESVSDISNNEETNIENENHDLRRLRQEIESINYSLRQMDGEDLQGMRMEEIQELQKMLEVGLLQIRTTRENQIEEENIRLHLEISNFENNTRAEFLLVDPLETRNHPQISEAIHDSYNPISQHKAIIQHTDVSDTSLQLGLSI